MKSKTFSNGLVVKHRKSAIIFEDELPKHPETDSFIYGFTPEEYLAFGEHMKAAANESWTDVVLKEAHSEASDYYEYYDRKYDNNGNLHIKNNALMISAPYGSTDTLYQFNKAKIQSFLYDLNIVLEAIK